MKQSKPKVQVYLKKHEYIIAVTPEYCHGPGWGNSLLKVHIADTNLSTYRVEYIQPEDQNRDQAVLFHAGEAMQRALVESLIIKQEK